MGTVAQLPWGGAGGKEKSQPPNGGREEELDFPNGFNKMDFRYFQSVKFPDFSRPTFFRNYYHFVII